MTLEDEYTSWLETLKRALAVETDENRRERLTKEIERVESHLRVVKAKGW